MNPIEQLHTELQRVIPDLTCELDPAASPTGSWWLDARRGHAHVVIEWKPDMGFGVTATPEPGLGEGSHEVYSSLETVARRVGNLLAHGGQTTSLESLDLPALRLLMKMTQQDVAREMQVRQAAVSKLESRTNMHIATLDNYVEALGGELEIWANFPDRRVRISPGSKKRPAG